MHEIENVIKVLRVRSWNKSNKSNSDKPYASTTSYRQIKLGHTIITRPSHFFTLIDKPSFSLLLFIELYQIDCVRHRYIHLVPFIMKRSNARL